MVKVNSDFFVAYNVHGFCWHGLFRVVFEIICRCLYSQCKSPNNYFFLAKVCFVSVLLLLCYVQKISNISLNQMQYLSRFGENY
jgi:hypothetical protein